MKLALKRTQLMTFVCILSGCSSMAPDYQQPESPVPDYFNQTMQKKETSSNTEYKQQPWRNVLRDSRLQQVVSLALNNNRDLRIALLDIDKARAEYLIEDSARYPAITANAQYSNSENGSTISRASTASVGISSWELDLFGRLKSLNDEALNTWLATAETQRSTRMTLVAEVTSDWLNVWAYQRLMTLAEQTYGSQQKTLTLTKEMHRLGAASGVDLASVQTSVQSARGDVAEYKTELKKAQNALNLVVGTIVRDELLPSSENIDQSIALIPLTQNISSAVLLQRPDVLSAEHSLKAANANIGAARAALFPSISLTTTTGLTSNSLSQLFSHGTGIWSFIPSINIPIFNAGEVRASIDVSKIEKQEQVATYEKTIQTAFSEIADALDTRAQIQERLNAKSAELDATARSYHLTEELYRNGSSSYLDTLTTQRSYYNAQQELISLQLEELGNRVTLYKVLGGGADAQALTTESES